MTRINCVPVTELSDAHLGAEYRELPRIFSLVHKAHLRGERANDPRNPKEYVLGTGHVRFFYPRLAYLVQRFADIVFECKRRNRKCSFEAVPECLAEIPTEFFGHWEPTEKALQLNRARILERTTIK